jgi:integrase
MGEVIRKTKGGKFVGWYIRYVDADGKRKQRATKQPSHAEARRMLIEIEARIARGMAGMEERHQTTLTVAEIFERFVAECSNPKCKDLAAYRKRVRFQLGRVRSEVPQVARLNLAALSPGHIAKIRDGLGQRYQAGTVRTTLIAVSAALTWAVREGLIATNPAKSVARPPSPTPRLDFFSTEEVRRLLEGAERGARSATGATATARWSKWVGISLALHTGMRKGEVFGLRWQDIDLEQQRLTVARSYATTPKSGKARHLRLPASLVPLLSEWRQHCPSSPIVCPVSHYGSWGMSLNPSCEHGLPKLMRTAGCRVFSRPWHMLRHTFASHFMQNGGNLLALSQILGHSDVKVTMIYAHLSRDFLDGQMEKVKF